MEIGLLRRLKVLFVFGSVLCSASLHAQKTVPMIDYMQLQNRLQSGRDTTFVINFWATWCAPCVKELPDFEKLQANFKNQKIKVLLVSMDSPSELEKSVIPFVKKKKFKSETLLMNEPDQQAFIDKVDKNWQGSIPATIFVNTQKNIRSFNERSYTYDELLTSLHSLQLN